MTRTLASAMRGFTLFELLVAMAIFALVSVMAYGGLSEVLADRQQTDQVTERLGEFQLAFLNLGRDLNFAVPRPVRGGYGDTRPPFMGADGGLYRMELTRQGRRNPAHLPRSSLERVAYSVQEEVLYRVSWPVLDRAQDTEPRRRALLRDVREVRMRFLDNSNEWQEAWPPLSSGAAVSAMPKAVEIVVRTDDWGEIRRVYDLPES